MKIEILFEDSDLVVVNKPPGVLTIPDRFDSSKPNLSGLLRKKRETVLTVHRLDKETSGVIVFAKNESAHKNLSIQFENRTVDKTYHVLLEGLMQPTEGKIDQPIAPHPAQAGKMMVSNKGKKSKTTYMVLEQFQRYCLVAAKIHTGRTHQIRVHFESIGYPLAVDKLYGAREKFMLSEIKLKKYRLGKNHEERPLISRSSLHAFHLGFIHPDTKKRLDFEAAYPKDFRAVLQQLRKWNK